MGSYMYIMIFFLEKQQLIISTTRSSSSVGNNFGYLLMLRYIVSDCNAVPIIYEQQGYAKTPEDAVAAVLSAGKPKIYFRIISSDKLYFQIKATHLQFTSLRSFVLGVHKNSKKSKMFLPKKSLFTELVALQGWMWNVALTQHDIPDQHLSRKKLQRKI